MRPPLLRSRDRTIAGVAAGLSAHLGVGVTAVRISFIVLSVFGGAGALLYAWLWVFLPNEEEAVRERERAFDPRRVAENFARDVAPWLNTRRSREASPPMPPAAGAAPNPIAHAPFAPPTEADPTPASPSPSPSRPLSPPTPRVDAAGGAAGREILAGPPPTAAPPAARRSLPQGVSEILLGGLLLLAGLAMVLEMRGVDLNWQLWLPLAAVVVGAVVAWIQLDDGTRGSAAGGRGRRAVGRLTLGLLLVAVGIFSLVTRMSGAALALQTLIATIAIIAGLLVVVTPWAVKYWRELGAERAARAREAERADIAAHLHDSVLQTLALIQNRAASEVDVTRLARAQERELREWLYRDADRERGRLADRVRGIAAEMEDAYGLPVEIVAVGDAAVDSRLDALVQAAREAIQNAAKHAGGPISVYVECADAASEVFVRDRGPGFDPAQIPADRLGVRESLIGRMERHGGTARIRNTGAGTEVALRMPTDPETEPKENRA